MPEFYHTDREAYFTLLAFTEMILAFLYFFRMAHDVDGFLNMECVFFPLSTELGHDIVSSLCITTLDLLIFC